MFAETYKFDFIEHKKPEFICVLNLRYLREPFFPLINAENIFKKRTDPFSLIFAETYKFDFIEHKKNLCLSAF